MISGAVAEGVAAEIELPNAQVSFAPIRTAVSWIDTPGHLELGAIQARAARG